VLPRLFNKYLHIELQVGAVARDKAADQQLGLSPDFNLSCEPC
jgi:hypothetical protein